VAGGGRRLLAVVLVAILTQRLVLILGLVVLLVGIVVDLLVVLGLLLLSQILFITLKVAVELVLDILQNELTKNIYILKQLK